MTNNIITIVKAGFEAHEFCLDFKQDMIDVYNREITKTSGFNIPYFNKAFNNTFIPMLKQCIHNIFDVDENIDELIPFLYIQDNKNFTSQFHNHVHKGTISTTFYIDPPEGGGEFEYIGRILDNNLEVKTEKPEKNILYMFPGWLYHRPTPQQDEKTRICINVDYNSRKRPILKELDLMW